MLHKLNFQRKFNLCACSGQFQRFQGHCFCFHRIWLGLLPLSSQPASCSSKCWVHLRGETALQYKGINAPTFLQGNSAQAKDLLYCNYKCKLMDGKEKERKTGAAGHRSKEDNDMPKKTRKIQSEIKPRANWNKWHLLWATAKLSSQHVSQQISGDRNQEGGSQRNNRGSLWINGHYIGICKDNDEGTTPSAL